MRGRGITPQVVVTVQLGRSTGQRMACSWCEKRKQLAIPVRHLIKIERAKGNSESRASGHALSRRRVRPPTLGFSINTQDQLRGLTSGIGIDQWGATVSNGAFKIVQDVFMASRIGHRSATGVVAIRRRRSVGRVVNTIDGPIADSVILCDESTLFTMNL